MCPTAAPTALQPVLEQGRPAAAPTVLADLERAREAVQQAERVPDAGERFVAAHMAALRVAAVVLAVRSPPVRGGRPRNGWRLLARVAPELAEWAFFFAATEANRDVIRAGGTGVVTARQADDLVRDAATFLTLVEHAVAPPGPGHVRRAQ